MHHSQEKPKQQIQTLSYIINHPRSIYFIFYAMSYLMLGQVITCLGPIIPYLAQSQNRKQTQYSFLLVCRALGFISGSVILRMLGQRFSLHQVLCIGATLLGGSSICFGIVEDLSLKGICIYFQSVGCSFAEIGINLSAIDCFKGDNLSLWLQNIHGCFGVGGLIGPFSVYYFQLFTLDAIGYPWFVIAVVYYHLYTPQKFTDVKQMEQQDKQIEQLPKQSITLLSVGFLLTIGQEMTYATWISSYSVLYKLSTKQHATFYSSLFWVSVTVFRFIFALLKGSPSVKMRNFGIVGVATTFLCYFLIFKVHSQVGLISMSILYGLSNSVLFPLLMTIPEQFGYKLTIKQTTLFTIWASLGEGCLGLVVGKLMQWFSYNWLLYSICLMNIALIIVVTANARVLSGHKQNKSLEIESSLQKQDRNKESEKPRVIELAQIKQNF